MIRFDMMHRPFRARRLAMWNLYYVAFIVTRWNERTTFELVVAPSSHAWVDLTFVVRPHRGRR